MYKQNNHNATSLDRRLSLKDLEVKALLEITQAINGNVPAEALYKIYNFTLRANLSVQQLCLFVREEEAFLRKVAFGLPRNPPASIITEKLNALRQGYALPESEPASAYFQYVLPIINKDKTQAYVFLGAADPGALTEESISFIQTLSNILFVAIENKKLIQVQIEREALRKEIEIARQVQSLLLPKSLPDTSELRVNASYLPHQTVGGDYYDCLWLNDDEFLFCIADVSGKGVPAALLMSNFQASLHTLARKTNELKEIVEDLNLQIRRNSDSENFITVFLAVYNRKNKQLRYVNAGHNPPLLVTNKDHFRLLDLGTTILGIFQPLPFLNEGSLVVNQDLFFAYTDGLSEVSNHENEEFGADRIRDCVLNGLQMSLDDLHGCVIEEIEKFKQERDYTDDITILSLKFK